MTDHDPEAVRVDELIARARQGPVSDAEREELALYAAQDPGVLERLEQAEVQARLGEGWLARVQADIELERIEHSPRARLERGAGLALVGTGFALSFLFPVVGAAALGTGALTLAYSYVRVRFATHAKDPYKDVIR